MLNVRSPHAIPFALLAALAAACSSSSGGETADSGTKDTGAVVTHHDASSETSVVVHDAGKDSGKTTSETGPLPEAGFDAGPSGTPPVIPATAKKIQSGYFVSALGLTSDDYLIYQDSKGGLSASDISGNITQIAPGPTVDGGNLPQMIGMLGQVVAVLTNFTTKTANGQTDIVEGTLSIWTHSLGKLTQIATNSTGIVNIAVDSSYVIYTDSSNSAGTAGNIGVIATTSGATGADLLKNVVLDVASSTCAPFALEDKGTIVTTSCTIQDGGDSKPIINAFAYNSTTSAWVDTTLLTNAAVSNLYGDGEENTTPDSENFAVDTAGLNALTVSAAGKVNDAAVSASLNIQALTSTTPVTILDPFSAPVSGSTTGSEFFYLSTKSTFALFTQPNAHLGYATLSTSAAPVVKTLNATDTVLGVEAISPDEAYDVDYSTALDMTTDAPSALFLRNLATGTSTALTSGSSLVSIFGANGWLTDATTKASTYLAYTTDLKGTGAAGASTGTLYSVAIPAGTINEIVSNTTVWNAYALTGTTFLYNQNYIPNSNFPNLPNGAASADIYTVSATGMGPGTMLATGADAADSFYVTSDKSHIFITFSNVSLDATTGEGSAFPGDGLYVMPL